MGSRLREHLTFANVGVILALVLAGSGFAVAAIPGPGGVIHACLNKRTGALRVIDSRRHCTSRERAINWNQRGRPGATGVAGTPGKQGNPGSDAQFNDAAAGGDLAGTYPNPEIKSGTINGTDVAPDSITGVSINESTLGQVPDAAKLGGVGASGYVRGFASASGTANPGTSSFVVASGIQINVSCVTTPSNGNKVSVSNSSGSNLEVFIDDSRNMATTSAYTQALASGSSVTTDVDTAADTLRRVIINTNGGGHGATTTILTVVRRASNFCSTVEHSFI